MASDDNKLVTTSAKLLEGDHGVRIPYRPATLENIDFAMGKWLGDKVKNFVESHKDWKKVPVLWVSAERAYQMKHDQSLRDSFGALILPIMTFERTGVEKDLGRKGVIQANLPEKNDPIGGVGGRFTVAKEINVDKTGDYADAVSARKFGDVGSGKVNFNTRGRRTKKIVYDIYSIPTPVYLNVTYEVNIRTRYQEQMNQLLTPFVVYSGAVTQFIIEHEQHKYEAFFDSSYAFDNNVASLGEDERIYNTKITINVLGYVFGEGKNRDRPYFSRRENPVEIVLPSERVMVGDIPDWTDRSFFRGGEAVTVTHGSKQITPRRSKVPLMPNPRGEAGGSAITIQDEGADLTTALTTIDFTGVGVTATAVGNVVTVDVPASAITAKEEGVDLTTAMSSIDFVGSAITATTSGNDVTVTVNASAISASDEGVELTTGVDSLNFVGPGVTATNTGGAITVTITGSLDGDTINNAIITNSTYNETPAGLVNSVNTVYTLGATSFTSSILVFQNGILQRTGSADAFDYTVTADDEITFTAAPTTGDYILVSYVKSA
jgi:hypothetical protein